MTKKSAGILVYRKTEESYEVLLVHPGGPFWKNKEFNAWSIPKGLVDEGEDELNAAIREFTEETGFHVEKGNFTELEEVKVPGGKIIKIWAIEADYDPEKLTSNTFKMEWPPHSGYFAEFPEVDKGGWFEFDEARNRIVQGQVSILEQLASVLKMDESHQ